MALGAEQARTYKPALTWTIRRKAGDGVEYSLRQIESPGHVGVGKAAHINMGMKG